MFLGKFIDQNMDWDVNVYMANIIVKVFLGLRGVNDTYLIAKR